MRAPVGLQHWQEAYRLQHWQEATSVCLRPGLGRRLDRKVDITPLAQEVGG